MRRTAHSADAEEQSRVILEGVNTLPSHTKGKAKGQASKTVKQLREAGLKLRQIRVVSLSAPPKLTSKKQLTLSLGTFDLNSQPP